MKKLAILVLLIASGVHAEEVKLKVISYNIRYDTQEDQGEREWSLRRDKVAAYLLREHASIFGLQEVLINQLQDLTKQLPAYQSIGVGRDDGKVRGEFSPIFYDRKVWKSDAEEQGTFWLSDTPAIPNSKSWGNEVTRICTWARLTHRVSGKSIYVLNTHWDHSSQRSRMKAAELILRKLNFRKYASEPIILLGDFNADTENPAIKSLLASGLLMDSGKTQFQTFNGWSPDRVAGRRIDHIFISAHWKKSVLTIDTNGNPAASDHHPVKLQAFLK